VAGPKEHYLVMFTDVSYITDMLQTQYPKAKNVWVRRAAQDLVVWYAQNPNPTEEQINAQDARVKIMCTKGTWF